MTRDEERAARLAGAIWAAVSASGGPDNAAFRHYPAVLDPAWLAALPLPWADALPAGRSAAMPDPSGRCFERHDGGAALRAAYERLPRTRIIEDIGWGHDTPWAALAGQHLTRLAGTGTRVIISVYQSASGDQELGTHRDTWTGAVVQAGGAKTWRAGEDLTAVNTGTGDVEQANIAAGDILVIPKNLPHHVTTPPGPGHSTHLVFAINRDPALGMSDSRLFGSQRAPRKTALGISWYAHARYNG